MVTARDGAPDYRLATATVTVKVIDIEDEVPVFHQSSYEARVKENVPDYNVIQVTVSRTAANNSAYSRLENACHYAKKRLIRCTAMNLLLGFSADSPIEFSGKKNAKRLFNEVDGSFEARRVSVFQAFRDT